PGPLSVPLSYRTVLGLGPVNIAVVPLLAALVVYLAAAGRRPGQPAPAPLAFAWPALERAGGVCLGLAGATAATMLARLMADGPGVTAMVTVALGLVVLAALTDRFLPVAMQRIVL